MQVLWTRLKNIYRRPWSRVSAEKKSALPTHAATVPMELQNKAILTACHFRERIGCFLLRGLQAGKLNTSFIGGEVDPPFGYQNSNAACEAAFSHLAEARHH
jgi:hypothetical protein